MNKATKMADNTFMLSDSDLIDQFNIEDNDTVMESGEDQDNCTNKSDAPMDEEDDDFELHDYDDLGSDNAEDRDETKNHDPEYEDKPIGQKRRRARSGALSVKRTQVFNTEAFIIEENRDIFSTQNPRVPGTFGRRERGKSGGLPAYHKKVSATLDSDDELMLQMRMKGYSDRQIADKLANDGRVRYDTKSISTRIMRIRLAQAGNVDFLLKEGYKEWEFKDDCLLVQAYALADIEVSYEIERIRAWRFRKVSEYMRRLNKDALFSETACRERYNSLIKGTARIPTAMDDNPAARRKELAAYRTSRETIRAKEALEKAAKDAQDRKAKDEAREKNAQKAQETASRRASKEAEKAQRAMQRAAKAQLRAQRAAEDQQAKMQRNEQIKKQKAEAEEKKTPKTMTKSTPKPITKTPPKLLSKPLSKLPSKLTPASGRSRS